MWGTEKKRDAEQRRLTREPGKCGLRGDTEYIRSNTCVQMAKRRGKHKAAYRCQSANLLRFLVIFLPPLAEIICFGLSSHPLVLLDCLIERFYLCFPYDIRHILHIFLFFAPFMSLALCRPMLFHRADFLVNHITSLYYVVPHS